MLVSHNFTAFIGKIYTVLGAGNIGTVVVVAHIIYIAR